MLAQNCPVSHWAPLCVAGNVRSRVSSSLLRDAFDYRIICAISRRNLQSHKAIAGYNTWGVLIAFNEDGIYHILVRVKLRSHYPQSQVYARLPRSAVCDEENTLSVWTLSIATVILLLSSELSSPRLIILYRILKTGKSRRFVLWTAHVKSNKIHRSPAWNTSILPRDRKNLPWRRTLCNGRRRPNFWTSVRLEQWLGEFNFHLMLSRIYCFPILYMVAFLELPLFCALLSLNICDSVASNLISDFLFQTFRMCGAWRRWQNSCTRFACIGIHSFLYFSWNMVYDQLGAALRYFIW